MLAPVLLAAPTPLHAGEFEDAVLAELNQVRADPQAYARELRRAEFVPASYAQQSLSVAQDDPSAVEDAIAFLTREAPVAPLESDAQLAAAAQLHAARQARTGEVGHGAPGSFVQRLQSQGVHAALEAESISYGQRTPREVVRQLVVDSGVADRAHRRDVFETAFQSAGISCGPHAKWGAMCVIEYAGGMVPR